MIPYYILVASPFVFAFVQAMYHDRIKRYDLPKNNIILAFFGVYFLLLALRSDRVGVDIPRYLKGFERISQLPWMSLDEYNSEFGYIVLNKLISMFTNSKQLFLTVIAAITVTPVALLYYWESENPLMSIALFLIFPVFIMNFSGLRQALAIAMGVPAFYMVKNRKPLQFLFFVLLAFLFHSSAFVLLIMYPAYYVNIQPKHLLWMIPVFFVALLFVDRIFLLILPLFGEEYRHYSEITQTGAYSMLILFALFTAYAFLIPNEELLDDTTRGMRNYLVLSLFIQIFSTVNALAMRMNYYFLIFIPLLIPKITNRWEGNDRRYMQLLKAFIVVFFTAYYLRKAHAVDSLGIYPYVPFWEY